MNDHELEAWITQQIEHGAPGVEKRIIHAVRYGVAQAIPPRCQACFCYRCWSGDGQHTYSRYCDLGDLVDPPIWCFVCGSGAYGRYELFIESDGELV